MSVYIKLFRLLVAAAFFALYANAARAGSLSLTADGVSNGFKLSTFVNGFANNGAGGPIGLTFDSAHNVIVSDEFNSTIYKFSDTDNQSVANNLGFTASNSYNGAAGLVTTSNGNIYLAEQGNGDVVQIDSTGKTIKNIASIPFATGIISNSFTGNLFVSSGLDGIWNLNPLTGQKTLFENSASYDGMALSADGKTLYTANYQVGVLGYDTTTGAKVYDSGSIPGADGIAIGTGSLLGKLFVNTNFGNVVEIDLSTNKQTTIASGGSRGDFLTVDPNSSSLLLTQTDSVVRLTAPTSGGFIPSNPVAAPATLSLLCAGIFGFGISRRVRGVTSCNAKCV